MKKHSITAEQLKQILDKQASGVPLAKAIRQLKVEAEYQTVYRLAIRFAGCSLLQIKKELA